MTRIVVVPSGITSTLHTNLALARRLQHNGHEVTVVGSPETVESAGAYGIEHVELCADRRAFEAIGEARRASRTGTVGSRVRSVVRLVGVIRRGRRSTVGASELLGAIDSIDPALVLVDYEAHVAVVACRGHGVPMALTTAYFALEDNDGVPPIDSWLTPDAGPVELADEWQRVRDASTRVRRRASLDPRRIVDVIGPISMRSSSPVALRAVARHTGAALHTFTDRSQWMRPWGYRDVPVLATNLRELEFGSGGSSNWHYVGPMVDRNRPDPPIEPDARRDLDAVVSRRRQDPDRRLVYCSLGSYWRSDLRLLSAVVEAFRRRPEWDLVIGLGSKGDPTGLGDLPQNVLILRWAPQVEVLESADAAIVHGGNATLNECVTLGVPMVVCSTGHLDQNGVASRVAHAGIGLATSASSATADWIGSSLETVLGDPAYRERVSRLAAIAAAPSTVERAAELVDHVIGG